MVGGAALGGDDEPVAVPFFEAPDRGYALLGGLRADGRQQQQLGADPAASPAVQGGEHPGAEARDRPARHSRAVGPAGWHVHGHPRGSVRPIALSRQESLDGRDEGVRRFTREEVPRSGHQSPFIWSGEVPRVVVIIGRRVDTVRLSE